jgi:nucleoside-diphosphate-sugar epimerase
VWVDLAVEALLRAANCGSLGPINVSSGVGTSLLDLAERIRLVTGTSSLLDLQPARPAEVTRFVADVTRMNTILGLNPDADPLGHLDDLVHGGITAGTIHEATRQVPSD